MLAEVGRTEETEPMDDEAGEEAGSVLQTLMRIVLPMVQRLVEDESFVEAEAALSIASRLSALLPAASLRQVTLNLI